MKIEELRQKVGEEGMELIAKNGQPVLYSSKGPASLNLISDLVSYIEQLESGLGAAFDEIKRLREDLASR